MAIFRKPDSGITKEVNNVGVVIGALLLGPIFFAIIGEWGHALLNFGLQFALWLVLMGWVVHLIYSFGAPSIVNSKWKKKGGIRED